MHTRQLVFGTIAALAIGPAAAQLPPDMPRPDPGLWQIATKISQMGGIGMGFRMCVDESIDELMMQADEAPCTEQSYRRDGDRIVFNAVCQAEGSEARIEGVFSGDFTRAYQGDIVTTYSPPLHGMSRVEMNVDARWSGPCPPGQKPGEVILDGMPAIPGLGDIDLDALRKGLEQMQRR
jgi:hypothetical protein